MDLSTLIQSAEQELARLDKRRTELITQIDELKRARNAFCLKPPSSVAIDSSPKEPSDSYVTTTSPTESKIALFRSLFRGREDVFPRRFESKTTGKSGYQPVCKNEWVRGICQKPSIKCNKCSSRVFISVSDQIIRNHLMGYDSADKSRRDYTIGVFPLLTDNTCWFLAADFDKTTWQEDAVAFIRKCQSLNIPAVLERSRSGKGGHVWIFFEEPVPAGIARRMGSFILTEVMEERPEMGFTSYDRFFPNQDDDAPWTAPPSQRFKKTPLTGKMPEQIIVTLGDQIYIPKVDLPPSLRNRLLCIAAFQNPEFYRTQAMKMSTFGKPRIISCAEDHADFISLPRGCIEDVTMLLESIHIRYTIDDKRENGLPISYTFTGALHPEQMPATDSLSIHDTGVLSAGTAFGKTIVAIYLIAQRGVNTLILVNRRQLLLQWVERLQNFLDIPVTSIGSFGGGKRKLTGIVDVAIIQSLCRKNVVDDLVGTYGQIIVDECHHITAPTFDLVARRCKARYFLGLSATVTRKDGQHPVIFMQLGPLRYRVSEKEQAAQRPFTHEFYVRKTTFLLPGGTSEDLSIQDIYSRLCADAERNRMILDDIVMALNDGRSPLVLTERRDHVDFFADALRAAGCKVFVLQGGLGKKKMLSTIKEITERTGDDRSVLIATGRFIGEGFDDSRLDTLFLAHPVSWRGTLSQYAGRLHRLHHAKKKVIVYDYFDENVPVLVRMFERRKAGYRSIGYSLCP